MKNENFDLENIHTNQNSEFSFNLCKEITLSIENSSKKKYFKIKKFLKYEKIFDELSEDQKLKENKHRIKLITSKKCLNDEDKLRKMKTLSKIVRRYRRKYKNMKLKLDKNLEKSFKKLINKNRPGNKKDKSTETTLTLTNLIKTLKKLKNNKFEEF